ncbi:hypothetical protein SUGI_0337510 [Cryptomeria japonica]|nr:hypothetical protein SUGI_0337510 [Cryptomeria japonica]
MASTAAASYSFSSSSSATNVYKAHSSDSKWLCRKLKTRDSHGGFKRHNRRYSTVVCERGAKTANKPVVVGLAADSGCGKSTFMRRLLSVLGGSPTSSPHPANPHSNTLINNEATVICLDDYTCLIEGRGKRME